MTTEIPGAAPAPAEPKPNPFARIIGVFVSPDATFASIAKRPDWVVPLLLILIWAAVSGTMMAKRMDFAAAAREAMESNKNMTAEQAERGEKFAATIGKVASYASPAISVIIFLIIAGVLLLAYRLLGGEGTFKQAFSVTIYAWMPEVIKGIVTVIIMVMKGGVFSPIDLQTIVRSNPAFLVDMKTNPVLFAVLANLDLFGIWTLVLFIIGFAHIARVSKAKSAAIAISLRLVIALFGLIGPALQSLRK